MNRLKVRAATKIRRRPLHARRLLAAGDLPMEYSTERATPRWLMIGAGVLGVLVAVELAVGVVVVSL